MKLQAKRLQIAEIPLVLKNPLIRNFCSFFSKQFKLLYFNR